MTSPPAPTAPPVPPSPRRPGRALIAAGAAALAGLGALWASGLFHLGDTTGASGYDRCWRGAVCFFSQEDGRGEMCSWVDGGADWIEGPAPCPWTARTAPRSVFNNGFDLTEGASKVDVVYFGRAAQQELLGCVKVGTRTNLSGTVRPRSHAWVPNC